MINPPAISADQQLRPAPVWMAALIAAECSVRRRGREIKIDWAHDSGKAVYTNPGPKPQWIRPLGIRLPGWHTLAVSWTPGETAYRLHVYSRHTDDSRSAA